MRATDQDLVVRHGRAVSGEIPVSGSWLAQEQLVAGTRPQRCRSAAGMVM
jgi:hypothetical protein